MRMISCVLHLHYFTRNKQKITYLKTINKKNIYAYKEVTDYKINHQYTVLKG